VVRLSAIGDVIRTLPAVSLIRKRLPNAYIAWVTEEVPAGALSNQDDIDEVIIYSSAIKELLKKPWEKPWRGVREFKALIKGIRSRRFDMVLDFHGLFKSGVISLLSGAPERYGYTRPFSRELNYLCNNRRVPLPAGRLSRIRRNLVLSRFFLDETDDGVIPEVYLESSDEERREVDRIEAEARSGHRPFIIVHPGTSPRTPYKRWPPEKFAQVADMLIRRTGGEVMVTYGPGEEEIARHVVDAMEEAGALLPRMLSLTGLSDLFRRADVYIGGDTGPMHVASFSGTPVVAVFGPTDRTENEPYPVTPYRMVYAETHCAPCRKRGCTDGLCFAGVTPEMVADAVMELLDGGRANAAGGGS
jgi:ADP-heptose:LPS heptosyltransferase